MEHLLLPARNFRRHMGRQVLVVALLMSLSLLAGMAGYRYFEHLPWVDCFLNTAMLLGGMGEVDPLKTSAGKLFAGCYAIYAGLFTIACAGTLLTPVIHRIMHRLHLETIASDNADDEEDDLGPALQPSDK